MSVVPALPALPPAADASQAADLGHAVTGPDGLDPVQPAEAEAFQAAHAQVAHAQMTALPGPAAGDGQGLFSDMASHIDQLSTEMNDWFKAPGLEGLRLGADKAADPTARMQEIYSLVSKQFVSNTMLSMKLNVTNQEMEAVSKDKDQLMRGGS